jgi:hypothetical protein
MNHPERGAARARPLANVEDSHRPERAFQRVGFEPVVEELGDRHGQQAHEVHHALPAEAAHAQREPQVQRIHRRRKIQLGKNGGYGRHAMRELRPFRGVALAQPADRLRRAPDIAPKLERPALRKEHRGPGIGRFDRKLQTERRGDLRRDPADFLP